MFLVTSVTTLRERSSGTLERLLSMPIGKLDLLARLRARVRSGGRGAVGARGAALGRPLDLDVAGPVWMLVVVAVADAVLGTALGLLVSAFARTEFQAVQFMPALVIPQILLCGLFVARDLMPRVLEAVSDVLPLSYAVDAMTAVTAHGHAVARRTCGRPRAWWPAFALAALALGAATLRRRTA